MQLTGHPIKHITLYDLYDCRINRLPPRETAAS